MRISAKFHSIATATTTAIVATNVNANAAHITRNLTTSVKLLPKKIPVSKGLPLIGNLLALIRAGGATHLHRYIDERHHLYGRVFKEKLNADVTAIFISDPEVMRAVFAKEGKYPVHVLPEAWTLYNELYGCARGLFFMDGNEWLHHRRLMNTFLLKSNTDDFIKEAVDASAGSLNIVEWEQNLEEALYRWSLDTIVAVMLGKNLYLASKQEVNEKLDKVAHKIKLIFETSARLQLTPVKLAHKLRLQVWRDFVQAVDDALANSSDLVYELMTISQSAEHQSRHQNDQCSQYDSKGVGVIKLMLDAKMAPSDIIRIVVDLVLAAGDTTAYTMQWLLYSLATNPHYQSAFEPRHIKNYLRETLRLYPVAPFITRINTQEDIIVENYHIPRNTLLIYSLYTVGRDVQYFNQPDKFLPDRWLDRTPQMMQASLPFAMGARSCIGRRIAELQIAAALRHVLECYFIRELGPHHRIDLILKMISVPSKPVKLRFVRRD